MGDGVRLLPGHQWDTGASQLVGAGLHQRSQGRLTYGNGYREREWDTRVGTVERQILKLRPGTYFPSLLEPRRRHERALLSVVQEAYIDCRPRSRCEASHAWDVRTHHRRRESDAASPLPA